MKQANNQSGITLIEVLATLTITAIIGSVVYGVLFQMIHVKDKTQSHNELRQEANIVMTQLRTMHENNEKIWTSSNMLYKDQELKNALVTKQYHFVDAQITKLKENEDIVNLDENSTTPKAADNTLRNELTLEVSFVIADSYRHEYKLETIFPSVTNQPIQDEIAQPILDFYTYLVQENVFVYGSALSINGVNVNSPSDVKGTIVLNGNSVELTLSENNHLYVKNAYIDKSGNEVWFTSNTKLGNKDTEIVSISGNVKLSQGGGEIEGDIIYIDGNVDLSDGGKIYGGEVVMITGNVNLNNTSQIGAKAVYVGGTTNISSNFNLLTEYILSSYPNIILPNFTMPTFQDPDWYNRNHYTSDSQLTSGKKIFTESSYYYTGTKNENITNVIVVSKGDIKISDFKNLTGVLFAPNGEVRIEGDSGSSFEGVVIAKNGFYVVGTNKVEFENIKNYISESKDFPFK